MEMAGEDPVGVWDAARLGRVLDNIIDNAVKFSPVGGRIDLAGVVLAVGQQDQHLRLALDAAQPVRATIVERPFFDPRKKLAAA